jgi:hypothetical protein
MENKTGLTLSPRLERFLIIAFLILAILPLFIVSIFNHPCNDDYSQTANSWNYGIFYCPVFYYLNWSGNYFQNFLFIFNPLVYHLYWAYQFEFLTLGIFLFIGIYKMSGLIFGNQSKWFHIELCLACLFILFLIMPDVQQGFYWQAGIYNVYVPIILTIFFIYHTLKFYITRKNKFFIYALIFLFASVGCYEIFVAILNFIFGLFILFFLVKRKPVKYPIVLFLCSIAFSLASVLSPGNKVRMLQYPNSQQFMFSIVSSIKYSGFFLLHWLPFLVLILLVVFMKLVKMPGIIKPDSLFGMISPWYILFFSFTLVPIGLFPGFWAEGQLLPLRAVNVIYFFFLFGLLYFILSSVHYLQNHPGIRVNVPPIIKYCVFFAIIFYTFFRQNNITIAYKDILSGTAYHYNQEMYARNSMLSSKGDSCYIEPIKHIPKSLLFDEIPNSPDDWRNKAMCRYYGKKFIGLKTK